MGEIRTITTLRRKRDEIQASIEAYERQLAQARADLAHVVAAMRIFDASGDRKVIGRYVDTHRLFRYGELMTICKMALADRAKTTRELAFEVMRAKGLDTRDKVLQRAVGNRLIHSLKAAAHRKLIIIVGKRDGVNVWQLPPEKQ
jgi:hypothetical protein